MKAILAALCASVIACGGSGAKLRDADPKPSDGSGIVVRGPLSGVVLDALRARVPNMSVSTSDTPCPLIFFRGPRSVRNAGNVSVYLDQTRMADTCILQQINANDVERVEVYPNGNVSHPGIQRNANGIIIVYRIQR